ncbi:Quercetin 2,3-dioxygenase [Lachnellula suecica]|uniref:Quercetin 2,3-dioxygenase n=1 Tax=Lachnellula suecica TaxID=602035 RepID=A0A8T9C9D0_9HELO|nr:Quercetin 2,3-dioxygenase [Lachnellula suecica]
MAPIEHLTTPPGKTAQAYVLPCYSGELWTIPTSNSTMRLLVTGKETDNAFAILGTGGTFDKPIGFHFHKEAHDVFLCLKGKINVWANDKARSLGPGDFASVPPGTVHQYQMDSAHTEFVGLIIPGGWEEFFRFIGEPYVGPLFPTNDRRNPFEVLIPKLMAAAEKFDMIPVRDKAQFDPQPWDGSEEKLPGACEDGGYFLKEGKGDKWEVGGTVVRPLATRKETKGRFSIYSLEGSSIHAAKGMSQDLEFKETHHAVFTVEGVLKLKIDGAEVSTTAGETTFVPAGTKWSFGVSSTYARAYVFANGGGIGEVLTSVGSKYESPIVPGETAAWDESKLKTLEAELKFAVL